MKFERPWKLLRDVCFTCVRSVCNNTAIVLAKQACVKLEECPYFLLPFIQSLWLNNIQQSFYFPKKEKKRWKMTNVTSLSRIVQKSTYYTRKETWPNPFGKVFKIHMLIWLGLDIKSSVYSYLCWLEFIPLNLLWSTTWAYICGH